LLSNGLIIKINSDLFTVKLDNNEILDCKSRGKFRKDKINPLVGDKVLVNTNDLVIESLLDRKNYLDRPPVANIDIALIVTSLVKPNLSLNLLDKLISIVIMNNIEPVIVFTKIDLASKEDKNTLKKLMNYYNKIGIKTFTNKKVNKIKKYVKGKIVTVCGQTGAGKSTLINKFDKRLNLETNEISDALGRGVHTTRLVSLYEIKKFYVVDTPGFSSIDISNYTKEDIKNSFIEFRNIECKFKDCNHINEIGCNVKDNKSILKSRYENYLKFVGEIK
jgi:ribosome biogenesis GTPase